MNSTGDVYLHLASGVSLTGANTAGSFVWDTAGIGTLASGSSLTADSVEIRSGSIALTGVDQLSHLFGHLLAEFLCECEAVDDDGFDGF